MIIHDCEQQSPEWWEARRGIPTASEFHTVLASGKGGGESKTRKTYMLKLAGEIVTGLPSESYSNGHMERGKDMEAEARDTYAFINGCEPQRVGFITDDKRTRGASPDSLIGNDGVLEIKTKLPHLLIDEMLRDRPPPEHVAQCQGQIWVAEREWCDLILYWPGFKPVPHRVYRDEKYIAKLADEVARFNDELAAIVERVRSYGVAA